MNSQCVSLVNKYDIYAKGDVKKILIQYMKMKLTLQLYQVMGLLKIHTY